MLIIPSTLTTYDNNICTLHISIKTIPSIGTNYRLNMISSTNDIESLEVCTAVRTVEVEPSTSDRKLYTIQLVDGECNKSSSGEIRIYTTKGSFVFGYTLSSGKDNIKNALYTPEEHRTPFDIL